MPPAGAPRPQPLRASRDARACIPRAWLCRVTRRLLLCAAPALLVPANAALAAGEAPVVYRWVDDQGVAHYTANLDRVPSSVRSRVNEVRGPSADAPDVRSERFAVENAAPAGAAGAPAAISSPAPPAAPAAAAPTPAPAPTGVAEPATATGPAPVPAPVEAPAPVAPSEPSRATAETPGPPAAAEAAPHGPPEAGGFEESAVPSTDTTLATVPPPVPDVSAAPPPATGERDAGGSGSDAATLDARIAAIEQEIARDEASLQNLLSEPTPEGGVQLADRPEFREIATRLPKLQADLRALQDQRTPTAP